MLELVWVKKAQGFYHPQKRVEAFVRAAVIELKKSSKADPELRKKLEAKSGGELVLVSVTKKQMQKINFQFRHKNKPTDVLSFESPGQFGELILCPEVLLSQAKTQGWSLTSEFCLMILHGILHLLDYDHERSPREARKMLSLQEKIFFRVTGIKIKIPIKT